MELMDFESNFVGNEAESPLANSVIVDALTLARHRKISEPELKSVKYPITNPALTLGELWYCQRQFKFDPFGYSFGNPNLTPSG